MVSRRLDYYNSKLHAVTNIGLKHEKLNACKKTFACIVARRQLADHITPVLALWYRIQYKSLNCQSQHLSTLIFMTVIISNYN
jgi:hypothetical protein